MLSDDNLKALIESIIYVAPEPVSLDGIAQALEGEDRERVKAALGELIREYDQPCHGVSIRLVAGGYKFSTKPEHHETLRRFVRSLKPAVRLSKPALETLAVIAYRQPSTMAEIEQIRGVDCGGVVHTLMEKKLVVTAGRKNAVGRPILYKTSRDFLVQFGLKDVGELPSLKEFEELARQALGVMEAGEQGTISLPEPKPGDAGQPGSASAPEVKESGSQAEPDPDPTDL